jgi:signal peptidase I
MLAAVAGAVWLSGVRLFAFSGRSMEPTVMAGDYFVGVVGWIGARSIKRFDLVIFDVPPTSKWAGRKIPWMKRLIGLPGERVRLVGDRLFIDRREVKAPFLHRDSAPRSSGDFEVVLKPDEYFVLGDNLDHSLEDSRVLGPISKSLLIGRVVFLINRTKTKPPDPAPLGSVRPE